MKSSKALKVFISYKWEDGAHNLWVENFATDLRRAGIDAILDKWEVHFGDSFTDYMTSKINEADIILFIMTSRSVAAVESPTGQGGAIKFEMQMATSRRTAGERMRLIGIYREGKDTAVHLRDHRYVDFRNDSQYEARLKELLDDLLGVNRKPLLGNRMHSLRKSFLIDTPIMKEHDWDILLRRVKDGKVVPFLGWGAYFHDIPFEYKIAQKWAEKYKFNEDSQIDLAKIANFLSIEMDGMFPREQLARELKNIHSPDFNEVDEPHAVLASLPLPIYITTNYDNFLMQALKSQNKKPRREFCRWDSHYLKEEPSVFDKSNYSPTVSEPLVFHFYGYVDNLISMVLTQDDLIDFSNNLSRDDHIIPPQIVQAIASASHLYLGYRISDGKFRTLFRTLNSNLGVSSRLATIGKFQEMIDQENKIMALKTSNSWRKNVAAPLSFRSFISELRRRWEQYSREL